MHDGFFFGPGDEAPGRFGVSGARRGCALGDPALQRLQALPPPASGLAGDENYFTPPSPRIPERQLPPPPRDPTDSVAMRKWLDHCWALRNLYGSGN